MRRKELEHLVLQMENYLECWKQFSHFINLARAKTFSGEDETQFLEVKSMLTQQLEMLLSLPVFDGGDATREEIHGLIGAAPSLRFLSEQNENVLRSVENQWHKVFMTWQSLLGQLKVKQRELEGQGFFSSLFGRKKS
jgi:hypothetical protein